MAEFALYEVLNTLNEPELRRIGKMTRSPYFTHRPEMDRMFGLLAQKRYRNAPLPDKETLFKHSFPGRPYDDLLLRGAMSDLLELIEKHLTAVRLESDPFAAQLALAAEFRERNLSKRFLQISRKIERQLQTEPLRNAHIHRKTLDFQIENAQFITRTTRTSDLPLQEISNSIDTLYLAEKLRHACTQLSHQAVFKTRYDFGLLPLIIDQVEQGNFIRFPAIALYYYCYRFMTDQYSLDYFQQFRTELAANGHCFPNQELKNLYSLAINFCIRKMNEGNTPFIREGWELYHEGLQKGFLLENKRISPFAYNNIVAFGLGLKAYPEVEHFILKYQDFLEPTQRDHFVSFNLARVAYQQQNLQAALQHLQTADFKDLVNNLIAKTLLLKIYYELDEFDLLEYHLDNFRSFIRRQKLSDYHRQNYGNIISLVKKLTALKPGASAEKEALKTTIQQAKVLTERDWLLAQLDKNP